jgi:hypothetical protein
MTLQNLLGVSLAAVTPDRATVSRLLEAAARNIVDAQIAALSAENRFDAAYMAIMQLAMIALNTNGYRTLTSKPGHHQIVIQSLGKTLGIAAEDIIVLDALRKQRNLSDYSGDTVPESAVTECLSHAAALDTALRAWLRSHHPELV